MILVSLVYALSILLSNTLGLGTISILLNVLDLVVLGLRG